MEIFETVREACSPATWSRGVELARQDAVVADQAAEAGEIRLRVTDRDSVVARVVRLFPDDVDWTCDCRGAEDPCHHVAAAVIALRRAGEKGLVAPAPAKERARLAHRFRSVNNVLVLERYLVESSGERPFQGSLTSAVQRPDAGITATQEDLQVDLALQASRGDRAPTAAVLKKILAALEEVDGLTLDGKPVRTSHTPLGARIVVIDEGPGCRVFGEQDPCIKAVYRNGAVLTDKGTLHPVHVPELTAKESEIVRAGRFFGRQELNVLASEILPGLKRKMPIVVRSSILPSSGWARPRLEILAKTEDDQLVVEPRIAYGDPVIARVIQGRLVQAGNEVPERDTDEEHRLRDVLWQELGLELDRPVRYQGEAAVRMVARLASWKGDVIGTGMQDFAAQPPLRPKVSYSQGRLALDFEVATPSGTKRADPQRVLAAFREGDTLVPLMGGGYAPIPNDWLAKHAAALFDLLEGRDEEGRISRASLANLAEFLSEVGESVPADLEKWRQRIETFDSLPHRPPPRDLTAELRDYQRHGVDWLAFHRELGTGCLLADDMGLGKTLQAVSVIEPRKKGGTLVVAPTSVLENWRREISRFRPALSVDVYHGQGRTLKDVDVTLATYAILRLDIAEIGKREWDMVILDEAQNIKNPESQAARAAYALSADFRVALTGTPVENRLDDLWSQMRFLNPGFLGSLPHFQKTYSRPIAQGDVVAAERLRRRMRPFILRRRKKDVAPELPPRTEVVRWIELTSEEQDVYQTVLAAARRDILERLGAGGSVLDALEALLRLRQAACHPGLLPGRAETASSKLESLIEVLEEGTVEGHKALVFTQWTRFLDLMEPAVKAAGIDYLRLDGTTRDRAQVVDRFQDPKGPPVLLMSLKAGGVGLNLTAADHVILADPWWNPAAEDQAADRAHRIGQDRPVMVHRLVARGTVEEGILALQERKRRMAEDVVGAGSTATLTREDLLGLLG